MPNPSLLPEPPCAFPYPLPNQTSEQSPRLFTALLRFSVLARLRSHPQGADNCIPGKEGSPGRANAQSPLYENKGPSPAAEKTGGGQPDPRSRERSLPQAHLALRWDLPRCCRAWVRGGKGWTQ